MIDLSQNYRDISVTRGDTILFDVEIEGFGGDDPQEMILSCKKRQLDQDYIFQSKMSTGEITKIDYDPLTDVTRYQVKVEADSTAGLDTGSYFYDLQLDFNNTIATLLKGQLNITFDVTRNN